MNTVDPSSFRPDNDGRGTFPITNDPSSVFKEK